MSVSGVGSTAVESVTTDYGGDYQTIYNDKVESNVFAATAIHLRQQARERQTAGELWYSHLFAERSVDKARAAAEDDPELARELFASLGQAARTAVDSGNTFNAMRKVTEMESMELTPGGLDQYEMIFCPTMVAAKYDGTPRQRTTGFFEGFVGAFASAMYFESKHLVNFPNQERGIGWRLFKKAEYVGRNLVASAANLAGSHKLAKLAVK